MQAKTKFNLLGALVVALSLAAASPAAQAQTSIEQVITPAAAPAEQKAVPAKLNPAKRYFIEFRSRSALSYGHAFLVHGKLNAQGQVGQVTAKQVKGLHPFSESSAPWTVGHIVPVPAEHGFSDGDIEDEYITARYRVLLTEAEHNDTMAFISGLEKRTPMWHAVLYNCTSYLTDIAKHMGLKAPASNLEYPDNYIKELASMNGGRAILLGENINQPAKRAKPSAPGSTSATPPAQPKPAKRTAAAASAKPAPGQPTQTVP